MGCRRVLQTMPISVISAAEACFEASSWLQTAAPRNHCPIRLKIESVIKRHGMARGLVCYPGGGTIDGLHGNHILLAPPFIINEGHISELVEKLGETVDGALREVGVLD